MDPDQVDYDVHGEQIEEARCEGCLTDQALGIDYDTGEFLSELAEWALDHAADDYMLRHALVELWSSLAKRLQAHGAVQTWSRFRRASPGFVIHDPHHSMILVWAWSPQARMTSAAYTTLLDAATRLLRDDAATVISARSMARDDLIQSDYFKRGDKHCYALQYGDALDRICTHLLSLDEDAATHLADAQAHGSLPVETLEALIPDLSGKSPCPEAVHALLSCLNGGAKRRDETLSRIELALRRYRRCTRPMPGIDDITP